MSILSGDGHDVREPCGCYQAGIDESGGDRGCPVGSSIIAPTGEIVALSTTLDDELITATADLDRCAEIRDHIFNYALHRQPQHYGVITEMPGPGGR